MNGKRKRGKLGDGLPPEGGAEGRKLYCKPDYQYEKVFETMALACGKIAATQSQCKFNRKSS
jgi:hypothetical protein